METWFQVYLKEKVFGFAINEKSIIVKHPDYTWLGRSVRDADIRNWFKSNEATIIKIADVNR